MDCRYTATVPKPAYTCLALEWLNRQVYLLTRSTSPPLESVREIESIRLSPRFAFAPTSQTQSGISIPPLCDCLMGVEHICMRSSTTFRGGSSRGALEEHLALLSPPRSYCKRRMSWHATVLASDEFNSIQLNFIFKSAFFDNGSLKRCRATIQRKTINKGLIDNAVHGGRQVEFLK